MIVYISFIMCRIYHCIIYDQIRSVFVAYFKKNVALQLVTPWI